MRVLFLLFGILLGVAALWSWIAGDSYLWSVLGVIRALLPVLAVLALLVGLGLLLAFFEAAQRRIGAAFSFWPRILSRLEAAWPQFLRRLHLATLPGGRERLFRATLEEASQAIRTRRAFLLDNLSEESSRIELPNGEALSLRMSPDARLVRFVTLENELEIGGVEHLLGRVHDIVTVIAARYGNAVPAVSMRPARRAERTQGELPWISVVSLPDWNDRDFWREQLTNIRSWIGIGIDLASVDRNRVQSFRECWTKSCEGKGRGVISGMLADPIRNQSFGLTCSHAVPSDCGCVKVRGQYHARRDRPDAAILSFPSAPLGLHLKPDTGEVKANVARIGGPSRRHAGWIVSRERSYYVDGNICEFPAVRVQLNKRRHLFFALPLFRRRFANPGDSGSWVVLKEGNGSDPTRWIGLVQSGDAADVYVMEAKQLVRFFEKELAMPKNSLQPVIFTGG